MFYEICCETFSGGGDAEAANTFISLSPNDGNIRDVSISDPHLGTVDDPIVSIFLCESFHS